MKKVILILLMAMLLFSACKKDIDGSNGFKSYSFDDSSYLVITNPTKNKKVSDDIWVKIDSVSNRQVSPDVSIDSKKSDYVEHTLPYIQEDLSQFKLKSVRAASSTPVKARGYIVGEQKNIEDDFSKKNSIAKMVYEGEYCYIWVYKDEAEESKLSEDEIKAFADKFDSIFLKQIVLCGPKYNGITVYDDIITPAKKLSVMLFDIGQDKEMGSVYGYFHPRDYSAGNKMEIIYIDSYYAKKISMNILFSTLVHEFNHLLNYCNKTLKYGLKMESWYTEMLSMVTEDFFSDDLCLNFNETPKKRLLGLVNGSYIHGFGNWFNNSPFVSNYYTNAYAFGAYLARNYGGAELIHEIMINDSVNEESVVNAVNKINGTSYSFADLLCDFSSILINPQNEDANKPSLFKSTEDILEEDEDFTFRLGKIDLENLSDDSDARNKININILKEASDTLFDSYGFQIFNVSGYSKVSVSAKDFLDVFVIK